MRNTAVIKFDLGLDLRRLVFESLTTIKTEVIVLWMKISVY